MTKRQGNQQRGDRQRQHETLPADCGPEAQPHRIEAVAKHRHKHDGVAEVEVELQELTEVAMACGQRDADDGEHDADDLQRPHAQPEEHEIGKDDDDRDGRLLDRDVDGGRVVERGVEDDIEDGEAARAEAGKQFPVAAHFGPVLTQCPPADRQQDQHRHHPAQEHQHHRRDMADGKLARDRIAAPQQHGRQQEQIGGSVHKGSACRNVRGVQAA